ncbi:NF038122 family metalloprotease [Pelomonas cellulosilytica]|uniref:NF038122 family metalloprotease n=1 Tax=Pelomonas cellulosilytica TaxID=2906762 RepID=A0ABS8XN83_9BURK|nr:NF038122 family metalloprotease [Pelomonas sp. P8]MCE4554231.1 NF038122 family metalloprotease [Pelomonas sp. P8]
MPTRPAPRRAALAAALSLSLFAPGAQALDFVLQTTGAALTAEQLAGFNVAADYWKSRLTDNVTVYLKVGFDDLSGNTLGNTTWDQVQLSYTDVRGRLATDRTSSADATAFSHLQPGPALGFLSTQTDGSTRLNNDTTGVNANDNRLLQLTSANAKALGVDRSAFDEAGVADATIRFASGYAGRFAYQRTGGGVPADRIDFITVAEHEIGHALGFNSGVDGISHCLSEPLQCGTQNGFDNSAWYSPLDLYRYGAPGTLDFTVGGASYFSLDGGASAIEGFSSGTTDQASHFLRSSATLMRPIVPWGQSYDATGADLLALDAIGWNLATAVPEPAGAALLLGGLAVIGWARRRSQRVNA